ncbi:MAG: TIR domain-containing protein [Verrucomicrobia bacterium]|nr:TIR domain-containing protein [Verrucomicrobiota bacterium]
MGKLEHYQFDDPEAAFAESEKRIQAACETQSRSLVLYWLGLANIPKSLFKLTQLQTLYLHHNRLTEIPDEISQLTELRELHLDGNQLRTLPDSIRKLTSLQRLFLHDNEDLGLPREVFRRSDGSPTRPADIIDYCLRLHPGKRPLNEAKLILLGRGEVGKTSLVNRLVHHKFARPEMTRGIKITPWQISAIQGGVRLHVWDFGGQEIQHATHQFFLTERSLYLVVLNGRAGAEDEDAEYWLKFVKAFGDSSPTIVVLNKIKVQPFHVNRRGLREKYPFIQAFVETDCEPNAENGISELKLEIESALSAMEHVRADFPAGWFQIKERLAEMTEPFISFAEYRKICAEQGENDAQAQERLAGFLNALGIALNFREDPQLCEESVLNPHWITEGVYQIITSKTLAERQGELRLSDLECILPKSAYPPRMHGFLIELMRKFELCFPYHEDQAEHRYLVPELLGKEEPALKEQFPPGECLNFRYDYRLMPEGLLPRFITRTHTMSESSKRWRTGVVLRWEGCRALVKADKQERQVIVRVLGDTDESPALPMQKQRRLLAVIRENFDKIHAEMKEFKPSEWVALEGKPAAWIAYSKLSTFEQNQKAEFEESVDSQLVTVNVNELLTKTDVPGARHRGESRVGEKRPLKLFISYAHADEKWRVRLKPNLELLQREGLIEIWSDRQIIAGSKWDEEIQRKLNEAELYLFLMSTNLLNSSYVRDKELPAALKRFEKKRAGFVPVVVQRCSWKQYVGEIQGLPTGGKPVADWKPFDNACFNVEEGLRGTIAEVRKMLSPAQ